MAQDMTFTRTINVGDGVNIPGVVTTVAGTTISVLTTGPSTFGGTVGTTLVVNSGMIIKS